MSGLALIGASAESDSCLVGDIRKGRWADAERSLEQLEKPGDCPASIRVAAGALIEAGAKASE